MVSDTHSTIVQISDTHLFAQSSGQLAGVPTWESLRAVITLISQRHPNFDLLVVSGDIAHDEVAATYEALATELAGWLPRCRFIPGNHDDPVAMGERFGRPGWNLKGRHGFVEEHGEWRIVGLDSHLPGHTSGQLGAEQLEWLEDTLATDHCRPTLAFVHHPPLPIGAAWIDEIRLRDGDQLMALAARFPNLRFIGSGHVHQASTLDHGATMVCTTPSTAFQFTPSGTPKISPEAAPGYRWLELNGDKFRTGVLRTEELDYPPQR